MGEPAQPRTPVEFPYVTARLASMHCPNRRGRYWLAAQFGPDASLDTVLFELTRACKWQVPPATKRRKYVPYCRPYFKYLMYRPPDDEPPPDSEPPPVANPPKLRLVG